MPNAFASVKLSNFIAKLIYLFFSFNFFFYSVVFGSFLKRFGVCVFSCQLCYVQFVNINMKQLLIVGLKRKLMMFRYKQRGAPANSQIFFFFMISCFMCIEIHANIVIVSFCFYILYISFECNCFSASLHSPLPVASHCRSIFFNLFAKLPIRLLFFLFLQIVFSLLCEKIKKQNKNEKSIHNSHSFVYPLSCSSFVRSSVCFIH